MRRQSARSIRCARNVLQPARVSSPLFLHRWRDLPMLRALQLLDRVHWQKEASQPQRSRAAKVRFGVSVLAMHLEDDTVSPRRGRCWLFKKKHTSLGGARSKVSGTALGAATKIAQRLPSFLSAHMRRRYLSNSGSERDPEKRKSFAVVYAYLS